MGTAGQGHSRGRSWRDWRQLPAARPPRPAARGPPFSGRSHSGRSLLSGPGCGDGAAPAPSSSAPAASRTERFLPPRPRRSRTAQGHRDEPLPAAGLCCSPRRGGSTLGRAGVRGAGGDTGDRGCAHAAAAGGGRRGSAAAGDQLRPAPPRRGPPAPWGAAPGPPAPPALPALPARRPPGPPRGGWRPPSPELPCSLLLFYFSSRGHSPV